ncbi:hypothetical protein ACFQ2K_46605 [Streptomyces sanglieri]|uniref:Uncharacterized protein n=1 Tax=Streptomyces sanglieri TaxID=193460 RepID=A0ABW2X7Z0_9ACTN
MPSEQVTPGRRVKAAVVAVACQEEAKPVTRVPSGATLTRES